MSNVQGVNTTKVNAGTSKDNWVDQGLIKSGLKVMSDVYEAAALAIGQTIGLANLPDGAVVHDIKLAFDALGAGSTLSIGDSTDAARYISAQSTVAAGALELDTVDGAAYAIGTNAGDGEIIATVGGGAITGTVKVLIAYTN